MTWHFNFIWKIISKALAKCPHLMRAWRIYKHALYTFNFANNKKNEVQIC